MSENTTPHKADEYNQKIGKTLPYYGEFHRQTLELAGMKAGIETWLDLGCGTGTFETRILETFPGVKVTAVDPSIQMLKEARKSVPAGTVEFIQGTSEGMDYKELFDVVTAIQVHHYLQPEERKRATLNIVRALKPGGMYISFENVVPEEEYMKNLELERWKRYQISKGKSEEEAQAHIQRCGVSYFPITVEEHKELLRSAGFRNVYVFWRSYMQMGIVGIK